MDCSICGFTVANVRGLASHFRHQASTHPDYKVWAADQKWKGKTEDEDFVRCRECGFRSASLARHLKSAHGITADQYRVKHGSDALTRNHRTEAKRRAGIKAAHARTDRKGLTKVAPCIGCGADTVIALFAMASVAVCEPCRGSSQDSGGSRASLVSS